MSSYKAPNSFTNSSHPSTPERTANDCYEFTHETNQSTTPNGPPPIYKDPLPLKTFESFGSSKTSNQSHIQAISFSTQGNNSFETSLTKSFETSANDDRHHYYENEDENEDENEYEYEDEDENEDDEDEDEDESGSENKFQDENRESENRYEHSDGESEENGNKYDSYKRYDGYQYEEAVDNSFDPNSANSLSRDSSESLSNLLLNPKKYLGDSSDDEMEGIEKTNWEDPQKAAFKYEKIAREIYTRTSQVVEESDDLILTTEAISLKLHQEELRSDSDDKNLQDVLSIVSDELTTLWENYYKQTLVYQSEEYTTTVGPGPQAPNFVKANFLARLAFGIHHPRKTSSSYTAKDKPLPQTLLEWMEGYHNPYPNQFEEILSHKPSPVTHPHFWDSLFNCLIRGKVKIVINMMKNAGWEHSLDEEIVISREKLSQNKYSDVTLSNVRRVMEVATSILLLCPATRDDWNTRSTEWKTFRLRAFQALEDLKKFTRGSRDFDDRDKILTESGSFNTTAIKAKSLIPWHLYQNLLTLYYLVMGDMNSILSNSQDWCEATIALLAWWDEGTKDQNIPLSHLKQLNNLSTRYPISKYFKRKLQISFEAVTSDPTELQINSADEVQVALASLLEGDIETVICFLRCWSGPVSCAVAEVSSLAGWLPRPQEKSLINFDALDDNDLNILGINQSPSKIDGIKDETLIMYANNLCKRKELKSSHNPETKLSSWEISIAILGRLDSHERSVEIIRDFLNHFTLENSETVNKLWILLNSIGLPDHAESAAQRYADGLAENSHKYGEALYYYALAHNSTKVRNVLDLLISNSLIQSIAYPFEKDLDDHLRSLITSPQLALTEIASMDIEAARILHTYLSGYATLRKFYDLRDEVELSVTGKTKMANKSRKLQASVALIAVITSSSDQIRGGLYDKEHKAVVHVDFLLALLGEAMMFVNQADFILTVPQIETLLYAIEDLKSVPSRVYTACEDFFQTVVKSTCTLNGSNPTGMQQPSKGFSRTSSFSLIGNSMLASQFKESVGIKRGWDWRDGISQDITADDVIRLLRLGLANDLAKAWLMEIDQEF